MNPTKLRHLFALVAISSSLALSCPANGQSEAPSFIDQCLKTRVPPQPLELAMAREQWAAAQKLLDALPANDQSKARIAAVKVELLIAADKADEALAAATTLATQFPKDADAQAVLGEALFRKGRLWDVYPQLNKALNLDHCRGRTYYETARYFETNALYASAAVALEQAHTLAPEDLDIRRAWLWNLSSEARAAAAQRLLDAPSALDKIELDELKLYTAIKPEINQQRCAISSTADSTSIPFQEILYDAHTRIGWGLDVSFNGTRRRLEIDTGASGLILSRAAASRLHLEPSEHYKSSGIGDEGNVDTDVAIVESIRIGSLEFRHCPVQILDSKTALEGQDGLIGGDVFQSFILTLDYPGRQLRLRPVPPRPDDPAGNPAASLATVTTGTKAPQDRYIAPEMRQWTRVSRVGHDLLLETHINGGEGRLFLADTGSQSNLIATGVARETSKAYRDDSIDMSGISGKVKKVYTSGRFMLGFAGLVQPVRSMTSIDFSRLSHQEGVEISGIIGSTTLSELVIDIDYRDNLMHFAYDPTKGYHAH